MRKMLPQRRRAENVKFRWGGTGLFLSCGYYEDGTLGEVFISAGKLQSGMDTAAKDCGIAISMALQHGCSVETLHHAFLRKNDTEPEGIAGAVMALIIKDGLDHLPPFRGDPAGLDPPDRPKPLPPATEKALPFPAHSMTFEDAKAFVDTHPGTRVFYDPDNQTYSVKKEPTDAPA